MQTIATKIHLKENFLADCRSRVVAVDIVCPGFVDIHTHGIGGHEDVIQEIKLCQHLETF